MTEEISSPPISQCFRYSLSPDCFCPFISFWFELVYTRKTQSVKWTQTSNPPPPFLYFCLFCFVLFTTIRKVKKTREMCTLSIHHPSLWRCRLSACQWYWVASLFLYTRRTTYFLSKSQHTGTRYDLFFFFSLKKKKPIKDRHFDLLFDKLSHTHTRQEGGKRKRKWWWAKQI